MAPAAPFLYILLRAGLAGLHRSSRRSRGFNFAIAIVAASVLVGAYQLGSFLRTGKRGFAAHRANVESWLQEAPGEDLLIVRYGRNHNPHIEWVYNRADIDSAPVVWAREMDPELDRELLRYFEGRTVWLLLVENAGVALIPHPLAEQPAREPTTEESSVQQRRDAR